jgi:hypothetical protein
MTTRQHPKFPPFLLKLKDLCSKSLEWNITATIIIQKQIIIKKEDEDKETR